MFPWNQPAPKKKPCIASPVVCILAVTGLLSIVMMVRKKGKTAKKALSKAGCQCTKAVENAAEEIFSCGDEENNNRT